MTSSESEGQPPPRKKAKISAAEDGGPSVKTKSRGRPRKNTEDATAADRRRTQIRLAQRAYRQRKETTISSLQEQNSQLRSIINQMHDAFQHFNEAAAQVGLARWNLSLGQELQQTTETFARLVKTSSTASDQEEEGSSPDAASINPAAEWHNATATALNSRKAGETAPNRILSQRVAETQGTSLDIQMEDQHVGPDPVPEVIAPAASNHSTQAIIRWWRAHNTTSIGQIFDQSSSSSASAADAEVLPFGLVDNTLELPFFQQPQAYPVILPTPEFTPPRTRLTSPILSSLNSKAQWTYSLDEVTFSRRLLRRSLEAGLYILSSSKVRRSELEYIFRLSLPFMTLDQIRERFRRILQSGINDSLDMGGIPFQHIGGAGTHYTNRSWNPWTIGPAPPGSSYVNENGVIYMSVGSTALTGLDPSLVADMTGFEGEWFDTNDVEGYLEVEKGCRIDPQASFAECLIDVENEASSSEVERACALSAGLGSASSSTGSSSSQCSLQSSLGTDLGTLNLLGTGPMSAQRNLEELDLTGLLDEPFSETPSQFIMESWNNMSGPSSASLFEPSLPVVKQKQKKVAWVDVSKFVEELVQLGICLGRTPGFRRKDVDKAFKSALISAY